MSQATRAEAPDPSANDRYPPQIAYIIGNEGCERFSFYGMKNILTFFMIHYLLLTKSDAQANYHLFVSAVFFFPLLGGLLADRFLGKYRTILYLSLVYSLGNLCLAFFVDNKLGFYAGLGLIALGSGGIKPCVSALVGDQFTEKNKHLVKRVFALFYWIINFGSFFASLLIPKTLEWAGPRVAFGIPGVLMFISTIVLWAGRRLYIDAPPTGRNPHSFTRVIYDAFRLAGQRAPGLPFLDGALAAGHPPSAIEGARAALRVMVIFLPIPIFWALYDQKGSTWIVQATQMDPKVGPFTLAPSQLLALNPLLVMIIIPLNEYVIYPALERMGLALTPLRRMTAGMFVAGGSFVLVGLVQLWIDDGQRLSILWQAGPYFILTAGEVLVSTTGLEFAYSQAPPEMKSTLMSFWNLTVTIGNLFTALVAKLKVFQGATLFFFFAGLILLAAIGFQLLSRSYVSQDYFRSDSR